MCQMSDIYIYIYSTHWPSFVYSFEVSFKEKTPWFNHSNLFSIEVLCIAFPLTCVKINII